MKRTAEEIKEHFEIEKELAERLKKASKKDRPALYPLVYDELYQRVPKHPMIIRKKSAEETAQAVGNQMALLRRFLKNTTTFMEIGAGDCLLSFEVANKVKQVFAIEVSDVISKNEEAPENFKLILSDGTNIPVTPGIVNVAYSNQLMEHLHPVDAREQLKNIYRALSPGGKYICITPNLATGPHDISRYFTETPQGFHLKEYTVEELRDLFHEIGFSKVRLIAGARKHYVRFPVSLAILLEKLLLKIPFKLRKKVTPFPFSVILGMRVIGIKK